VLGWLMLAVLGIIWTALLFPLRRGPSPTSSVEDFERNMTKLAEANKATPGRWVLMPRKGERFMGPRDRERARIRTRRRRVFTFLLDATALALLMGAFPPFRPVLAAAAVLGLMLLVYTMLLMKIRADALERARRRRAYAANGGPHPAAAMNGHALGNGNGYGYGNGHAHAYASSNGNGNGHAHAYGNGNGNGHLDDRHLLESGVRLLTDDVHVVLRRPEELPEGTLPALAN
jgi:hypothetical protein